VRYDLTRLGLPSEFLALTLALGLSLSLSLALALALSLSLRLSLSLGLGLGLALSLALEPHLLCRLCLSPSLLYLPASLPYFYLPTGWLCVNQRMNTDAHL